MAPRSSDEYILELNYATTSLTTTFVYETLSYCKSTHQEVNEA